MNLIEMKEMKKKTEQNINRLLDDFSEWTGLTISDLDFNCTDITSLSVEPFHKEYLYNVEIEVRF